MQKYRQDSEKHDNVTVDVRTTYTPCNIYYYDEVFDYFDKIGISASGIWCDDKPWNDIRYLPQKVKDGILEKLSRYTSQNKNWSKKFDDLKKWMSTRPEDYERLQNSFIEFNTKVDNIRKEKFEDVFPEYFKLFA